MNVAVARTDLRTIALAYLELAKPRIVLLVLLTGVPALLMAARGLPEATTVIGAILGTALAAGSAAAFNHVLDRDIDVLMVRTKLRPLPTGVLTPTQGTVFAIVLGIAAWLVLDLMTTRLAAVIGLVSIFYYAVVYTVWLKRSTPQNIVIGGGAGATAPLIAWAAVTGRVDLPAVLLAAIVFFWTPPHFWALALYRREDYARANIPMLPVTHGEDETRRQILLYTLGLVPITLAPVGIGAAGPLYGVPALLLGALFAWYAWRLFRTKETARAVRLFRFSILYLFVLFVTMGMDAAVTGAGNRAAAERARAAAVGAVEALEKTVAVRVTASATGALGLSVSAPDAAIDVRRGGEGECMLRVDNSGSDTLSVSVRRSVRPEVAASFVRDPSVGDSAVILAPGARLDLPARFTIDPALPGDIPALTVSYSLDASR